MTYRNSFMAALLIVITLPLWAEPRLDYDEDDDGLIEIHDLADLNEIRNNITAVNYSDSYVVNEILGNTLYGVNDGCPLDGCNGYELANDLNFDDNNNGLFDDGDLFWNDGKGWQSIGNFDLKFNTEFNGNGYGIYNLIMRRPGERFAGLFGYAEYAHIHDFSLSADLVTGGESGAILGYGWKTTLDHINAKVDLKAESAGGDCTVKCDAQIIGGLVGSGDELTFHHIVIKLQLSGVERLGGIVGIVFKSQFNEIAIDAQITGQKLIGALAGTFNEGQVESVAAFSNLTGSNGVGGLIGASEDGIIKNVLLSGRIEAGTDVSRYARAGALIAASSSDTVSNVISVMRLPEDENDLHFFGALIGDASDTEINHSYWAQDLALRNYLFGHNQSRLTQVWQLVDLQCANATQSCNGLLFDDFTGAINGEEQALWNFGANTQAPAMVLSMGRFADTEGNGDADNWPELTNPVISNPAEVEEPSSGGGGLLYLAILWIFVLRKKPMIEH